MYKLLPSFLFIFCIACNNSAKEKQQGTTSPDTNNISAPEVKYTMPPEADTLSEWIGAYFMLDDNFSEQKDTAVINSWWKQKLAQVERYGRPENLFTQQGGGPNGSAWNPLNDLYIVATTGEVLKNETAELRLNNKVISSIKLVKQLPAKKTGTIYYALLPEKIWDKHLRNTTIEDLKFIHGSEFNDSLHTTGSAAPVSQVVEIAVHIKRSAGKSVVLKGIFQAAFGE